MANGHGGKRPNSGRKPVEKRLSNYQKAIRMLDENVENALQVLIDGLYDKDMNYRLRCAELLLRKSISDKTNIELTGEDGEPVQHRIEIVKKND